MDNKACDKLVEAIILQAIADYEFALKWKDVEPKSKSQIEKVNRANRFYTDVPSFFHSRWYRSMCNIDGDKILQKVEDNFKNGKKIGANKDTGARKYHGL